MRFLCLALLAATSTMHAENYDVWVGTMTAPSGASRGIYHLSLDSSTGALSSAKLAAETPQPGFLARHPKLPVLYSTLDGRDNAVAAWRIAGDGLRKRLEPLGQVPTGDGGPCHVSVDPSARFLFTAQYGGGSVASYRLRNDGSIAERASLVEHDEPSGVVADRQKECHPHWAGSSPCGKWVLVPDLGADRVYIYALDAATGELKKHGSVETPPGGGPRHFAFHPDGKHGYVVNELDMSLSSFDWEAELGELTLRGTFPTLTEEQRAGEVFNSASEVDVHPSGRFVYVGNRGHDSVTGFQVGANPTELTPIDLEPVRGSHPRHFTLDPAGKWLLAAGRDSNTVAVFTVNQQTGDLRWSLESDYVPDPTCVLVGK